MVRSGWNWVVTAGKTPCQSIFVVVIAPVSLPLPRGDLIESPAIGKAEMGCDTRLPPCGNWRKVTTEGWGPNDRFRRQLSKARARITAATGRFRIGRRYHAYAGIEGGAADGGSDAPCRARRRIGR